MSYVPPREIATLEQLKEFMDNHGSRLIYEGMDMPDQEVRELAERTFQYIEDRNKGDGNDKCVIWKVLPLGIYINVFGYYSSWDSDGYEGWFVVMQTKKVVTRWEAVTQTVEEVDLYIKSLEEWKQKLSDQHA